MAANVDHLISWQQERVWSIIVYGEGIIRGGGRRSPTGE